MSNSFSFGECGTQKPHQKSTNSNELIFFASFNIKSTAFKNLLIS
jgi:hypothetical protein